MKSLTARDMVLCGLFAALIAVGAFLRIPTPLVPITLQTLFVVLAALLLGSKKAALSVGVYIVLGLAGLPIFTQGGGIGYVLQPTFGYILGFALAAFVTGKIAEHIKGQVFWKLFLAALAGIGVVYLIGVPYYYMIGTFYLGKNILVWPMVINCALIFIPGDVVSCIVAVIAAKQLKKVLPHQQ